MELTSWLSNRDVDVKLGDDIEGRLFDFINDQLSDVKDESTGGKILLPDARNIQEASIVQGIEHINETNDVVQTRLHCPACEGEIQRPQVHVNEFNTQQEQYIFCDNCEQVIAFDN
ncbi:hypothetical protein I4U23_027084 [Adineta vaga]|nr:hypothetical protein I4U23_027084 [Adineta vaga]